MTASNTRRRTTGRCFSTSGMLHLHPGPVSTGFGFSAGFRNAALHPTGGDMMLLPSTDHSRAREVESLSLSLSFLLFPPLLKRVSIHHFTCADFPLNHSHKKCNISITLSDVFPKPAQSQINWTCDDIAQFLLIINVVCFLRILTGHCNNSNMCQ